MALILNIETATTVCSVSLFENNRLLAFREIDDGFTHAENLHVFIEEIIKETNSAAKDLHAIAVSKGPGSYTGLRIGVSTAKGLAYALKIPLISIDTLKVMSAMAREKSKGKGFFCPLIDARRMEVYTAVYDHDLNQVKPIESLILTEESREQYRSYDPVHFFGNGMPKSKELLQGLPGAKFIDDIVPSAKQMGELSAAKFENKEFEDVAYFEPFYLKDFMAGKKKGMQD